MINNQSVTSALTPDLSLAYILFFRTFRVIFLLHDCTSKEPGLTVEIKVAFKHSAGPFTTRTITITTSENISRSCYYE